MRALAIQNRNLVWSDGEPFFYLGDTAWEIFHRLSREEMEVYFAARAQQGFTAVQGVALAEFEGLTTPNYYGRLPLHYTDHQPDPLRPDDGDGYSYWHHVDYAVEIAARHGLFIAMLPTWGDKFNKCWGKGPVIFDVDNARAYGRWIAQRYGKSWNIIWMLGGDRPLEAEHRSIIDAMAAGIREVDPAHLITFHPPGNWDSTDFVGDAEYIDFHTAQTGHGIEQCYASDTVMEKMRNATAKPYMDSEPRYEDHPACFDDTLGYLWTDQDIRQNAYWNVLSGACGHTYGNHCVWSMNRVSSSYFPYTWQEALNHPGAEQISYVKKLRLSRSCPQLTAAPELIKENFEGMGHMVAAIGQGFAYVYSPLGIPFSVNLNALGDAMKLRALWFDLRSGEEALFAILPPRGAVTLAPPSQGKGCDWVLILEAIK